VLELSSQEIKELASFNYLFTAIRGIQAGREYYVIMCPLRLIPRLFQFNEEELPPELRAQRVLNKARIPQIVRYMVDNPKEYVFSSITASIDGKVSFRAFTETADSKLGLLVVPMTARLIINDGQHRRAAIEEALKIMPELGNETLSVVLFIDAGLKRSQQMFSDLNQHAIRPTRSLGILYDHRDNMARLVLRLAQVVPIFKNRVELEKTTISNRSLKLFTLNNVYNATSALLAKRNPQAKITQQEENLALEYWSEVAKQIPEWQLLLENKVTSFELRRGYVHVHGIVLHAIGAAGHDLIAKYPDNNWKIKLQALRKVDWSRSNPLWEGKAMLAGRINKTQMNVALTTIALKQILGLELTPDEKKVERQAKIGKLEGAS
jgi:DNA sulfur modification protein DndB